MKNSKKEYKLNIFDKVLPAIDKKEFNFYESLTDDEKKSYPAVILMRAMSSLGDQNQYKETQLLLINDLVNIGFWQLSKHHTSLQHLLMCITGAGTKQYHPWIASKNKVSKTELVDNFLKELHPGCNKTELEILKSQHTSKTIKELALNFGKSESEAKMLAEDAKNL